jgi:hypothetical protein
MQPAKASLLCTISNIDTTPGEAPIYLNSGSFNFSLSYATVTDNFFTNVPVSLADGVVDLFDITLANPERDPLGTYAGTYVLLGGWTEAQVPRPTIWRRRASQRR